MQRRTPMRCQAFSVDVARAISAAPASSFPIAAPTKMDPYIGIAPFAAITASYPDGRILDGTGSLPPRRPWPRALTIGVALPTLGIKRGVGIAYRSEPRLQLVRCLLKA